MQSKIGILLPRSDMFPALAKDFLNGLKLALQNVSKDRFPIFRIESIGNATNASLLMTAEKMILQEEVDLTISFCSFFKLSEFIAIFNAYKKPLIHVDIGGHIIQKEHRSPHVIHHTLNLWQTAYESGVYAAKKYGKRAAIIASIYDGGYHLSESFVRGFTDAGGEIVYNYVSPMDYKSETFETMINGLENTMPDVVFTLFSYKEGVKVFKALSQSSLNGKLTFLTIPLMTDEQINRENYQLENVYSIASWAFDEETASMKSFLAGYIKKYSEQPNIVSLLGYETGLTVSHCLNNGEIPLRLGDSLQNVSMESPRGSLTYTCFNEPHIIPFKLRKFNFIKSRYHNVVIENLPTSFSEELYRKFENISFSGWQNPYICT